MICDVLSDSEDSQMSLRLLKPLFVLLRIKGDVISNSSRFTQNPPLPNTSSEQ
jgi:hypothetical protein